MPAARSFLAALGATALLTAAGCSSPPSGTDSLAAGRARVLALVNEAASTLPASGVHPSPPATGTSPCKRTLLGYAVGNTGKHRVEAPILVRVDPNVDPKALLGPIEARWRAAGYTVDRSDIDDARYPKIRAQTPDGYDVVATALLTPTRQLDLYATSKCLRGASTS